MPSILLPVLPQISARCASVQVFTSDLLVCIFLLVCATLPAFSTNYYVYVTEEEGGQDVRRT